MAPEAVAEAFHAFETGSSSVQPLTAAAVSNQSIQESMRLLLMVRAYQVQPFLLEILMPRYYCCRPCSLNDSRVRLAHTAWSSAEACSHTHT